MHYLRLMLRPLILSALAVAILAIARPEKRRRSGDTIITIPLTRRANSAQVNDGMPGYRQLSQGGNNMAYVRRNEHNSSPRPSVFSTFQKAIISENLKLEHDFAFCTGQVSFGTHPTESFDLMFDTGSDTTWFHAPQSAIPITKDHNMIVTDTKWGRNTHQVLRIEYFDDLHVSGEYYQGKVKFAGVEVELHFGVVRDLERPSMFLETGILGLSFPKKVHSGNWDPIEHSFFWKAMAEGHFSSPIFAFDFSSPAHSQVHLGGLSKDHYIGRPEYHSIIDQEPLGWELKDAKLYLNGYKPLLENLRTVIDTGTTNIVGHPSQVKKIYEEIGPYQMLPGSDILYLYPCKARPVITFLWSKRRWTVSPEIFEVEKMPGYPGKCIGVIEESTDLEEGQWLLGIAFLRTVYASFHVDKRQIAFARLRNSRRRQHGKKR